MTETSAAPGAADVTDAYEMVVGLEVHVQLKTATKAFCNCSTEYGAAPNTNTCPVCLALPGALPVLNANAVELAMRAALALGCTVHERSVFARKNYFYPDLPKGYQISQFDQPLATEGLLQIGEQADGTPLVVGITRVHMEEDAGKSIHDRFAGLTAVDLNRSGVPLIEIVSEPDMRSPEEAGTYLRLLKEILEYAGVSDVNMEEGSLRVDANVSARLRGESKLGTKTEVKNMNSFSGVERALAAEYRRQCGALARGERIHQQTMLWDGARGEVRPARAKEGSHDYRYFPEPDLPPLVVAPERIDAVRAALPELPAAKRERIRKQYDLGRDELRFVTGGPRTAEYFETLAHAHGDAKTAANWMMTSVQGALNSSGEDISDFARRVRPRDLAKLLDLVRAGTVSTTAARSIFTAMVATGEPADKIAEAHGLTQVNDEAELDGWVTEALAEHPAEAARYVKGDRKLQGVFVGHVMKKSKGRADPKRVNQLLAARVTG